MTLYNIVLRNMKRNFKDYSLYFVAMIFSMVIYYTFASIQYNTHLEHALKGTPQAAFIAGIFKASKYMLILFVAVFIIYANQFFIRKRKKEVGLFSLLGIPKRKIGIMLFGENVLIGSISIVNGIIIGTLLSKGLFSLLLIMMGTDLQVKFEMPIKAIIETAIVFSIILLYTSFRGYRLIYRFKLIELFQAERIGEKPPKGSAMLAVLAILFIGSGYVLTCQFNSIVGGAISPMVVALGILMFEIIGTYLLFRSLTVILLQRYQKKKDVFYTGGNIVTIAQLLYRVKGTVKSLTMTTLLSAATLTAFGTAVNTYYNIEKETKEIAPYSFSYEANNKTIEQKIAAIFNEAKQKHPIKDEVNIEMVPVSGQLDEKKPNNQSLNFQEGSTRKYQLISQTNFHVLAKKMKIDVKHLDEREVYIYDANMLQPISKGTRVTLSFGTEITKLIIKGSEKRAITNLDEFVVIVPDHIYAEAKKIEGIRVVKNINVQNEKQGKTLTDKLTKVLSKEGKDVTLIFRDFYTPYQFTLGFSGILLFISSFLGLVFLLALGSIMYFKQIAEAQVSRNYFEILSKIGMTKQEMKQSISQQVRFSFMPPVMLAILHSLFAFQLVFNGTSILNMLLPILISYSIYYIIYFGYYLLAVHSYFNLVYKK